MSSDKPPELFLDRSLGKTSATRLRAAGHIVHLIAEYYERDAQEIGNVTLDQITQRFLDAMPAIHRAVQNADTGFWHIHAGGRITRMWP